MRAVGWILLAAACAPADPVPGAPPAELGASPLRRLTNLEYRNTIADLTGDEALAREVTAGFAASPERAGLDNDASVLAVDPILASQYARAAETVAAKIAGREPIARLGRRLFRRPLEPSELERYASMPESWAITGMLQSPHFLYRVELGALGPYAIATRLSYLLWRSAPDDALLDLAERGQLDARRMLLDPRAERRFQFFEDWLEIDLHVDRFEELMTPEVLARVVAVHDHPDRTSIVRRGLAIRTKLLCQDVPPPPDDVVLDVSLGALHRTSPACASCHELMDPLGVAFEGFDSLGRARTHDDDGRPIDTRGMVYGTRDADGPISGAEELAARLAASEQVADCFRRTLFRWGFGRAETLDDRASLEQLGARFRASGGDLREVFVALTEVEAFRR